MTDHHPEAQPWYFRGWYVLNEAGDPVPAMNDAMRKGFWEDPRRIIGREERTVDGETITVSTVFLGLDHNVDPDGPPVLWQTLVFGGALDREIEWYRSREAAIRGHVWWVEHVFEDTTHESLEAFAARVDRLLDEVASPSQEPPDDASMDPMIPSIEIILRQTKGRVRELPYHELVRQHELVLTIDLIREMRQGLTRQLTRHEDPEPRS